MHFTDIGIGILRLGDDRRRQWDKLPESVQRALVTKIITYAHEEIQHAFMERGRSN